MNVTNMRNKNSEPVEEVVQRLEEALRLAKAGELRSVAMVGALIGHSSYTSYTAEDNIDTAGHLEMLKTEILINMLKSKY